METKKSNEQEEQPEFRYYTLLQVGSLVRIQSRRARNNSCSPRRKLFSKFSFLDNELLGKHDHYLSRRITKGLFRSNNGTIINADVNGTYNILKNAFPKVILTTDDGIEVVEFRPVCWRLPEATP